MPNNINERNIEFNIVLLETPGQTYQLPLTPENGDTVTIKNISGSDCFINGNGNNIELSSLEQPISHLSSYRFIFHSVNGWLLV